MKRRYEFAVVLGVLLALFLMWRGALVPDTIARDAVETAGYYDVLILRRHDHVVAAHGCGLFDAAAFDVTASVRTAGRTELVVCARWPFQGPVVRPR